MFSGEWLIQTIYWIRSNIFLSQFFCILLGLSHEGGFMWWISDGRLSARVDRDGSQRINPRKY